MKDAAVHVAAIRIRALIRVGDTRLADRMALDLAEVTRPKVRPYVPEQLSMGTILGRLPVCNCPLGGGVVTAATCIRRQIQGDLPSSGGKYAGQSQRKRGRDLGENGGACFTSQCAIGRDLRESLGDAVAKEVRTGNRSDWAETRPSSRSES